MDVEQSVNTTTLRNIRDNPATMMASIVASIRLWRCARRTMLVSLAMPWLRADLPLRRSHGNKQIRATRDKRGSLNRIRNVQLRELAEH